MRRDAALGLTHGQLRPVKSVSDVVPEAGAALHPLQARPWLWAAPRPAPTLSLSSGPDQGPPTHRRVWEQIPAQYSQGEEGPLLLLGDQDTGRGRRTVGWVQLRPGWPDGKP